MGIHDPTQRLVLLRGIEVLRTRGSLAEVGRAPKERLFRDRYRLGCEVNYGGSPAVLAVDTKTDLKVVVKFLSTVEEYERQLSLYRKLKSEYVVRLADSYTALRPGQMEAVYSGSAQRGWHLPCIVLEWGECSLLDYSTRGILPAVEIKATFEALVHIVAFLHARGLAHCGLQPESFRVFEGSHWRLVSLDSCTEVDHMTPFKLPVCYAAPELVRELRACRPGRASAALDVWALGTMLWGFYAQQPLHLSEVEAMAMPLAAVTVEPPMGCIPDPQARTLIRKMLRHEPSERLPSERILKQAYLAGGLDTFDMESSYGPVQKGQLVMRSMLQQLRGAVAEGERRQR
jgi:serine/threonine protein kinase